MSAIAKPTAPCNPAGAAGSAVVRAHHAGLPHGEADADDGGPEAAGRARDH